MESEKNKDLVLNRIKNAGWAARLFGLALFALAIAMLLVPTLDYSVGIVLILISLVLMFIGNKLYKRNIPINIARDYLRLIIFVLIPTIVSLIGIIVLWYAVFALNSINSYYGRIDHLKGCPGCGNKCNFKTDLKCKNCGKVFWRSREQLDEYIKKRTF